ncbi:MAG: hypothetical protein H7840_10880 [Alphaproteobacteria bacterium]
MRKVTRGGLRAIAGAGVLTMSVWGAALAEDWIVVGGDGCKMWNPYPEKNESIVWHGACRNGLADGAGRVVETGGGVTVTAYGTLVAGKVHGDYYYEKQGRTCYEQKVHGIARQTLCLDSGASAPTIRAVDLQGKAVEAMRPLTADERVIYKTVLETIVAKSYVIP